MKTNKKKEGSCGTENPNGIHSMNGKCKQSMCRQQVFDWLRIKLTISETKTIDSTKKRSKDNIYSRNKFRQCVWAAQKESRSANARTVWSPRVDKTKQPMIIKINIKIRFFSSHSLCLLFRFECAVCRFYFSMRVSRIFWFGIHFR